VGNSKQRARFVVPAASPTSRQAYCRRQHLADAAIAASRVSAYRAPRSACHRCDRSPKSNGRSSGATGQKKDAADHDVILQHIEVVPVRANRRTLEN
jgi:hypothetical protein